MLNIYIRLNLEKYNISNVANIEVRYYLILGYISSFIYILSIEILYPLLNIFINEYANHNFCNLTLCR